jgi:hypothetical protein
MGRGEQEKAMNITWTNGAIALTKDLIFGVSVLAESGWTPLSTLDKEDLALVRRLVDGNPSCPWLMELALN